MTNFQKLGKPVEISRIFFCFSPYPFARRKFGESSSVSGEFRCNSYVHTSKMKGNSLIILNFPGASQEVLKY